MFSAVAKFDIPGVVTLAWDSMLGAVVVTWQGPSSPKEFHALLVAEIEALREHHASNLLVDCRLQHPLEVDVEDRLDRHWLPDALAAGLARLAVVLPSDRNAAVSLMDRFGRVDRDALEVRFFETVPPAHEWLRSGRA